MRAHAWSICLPLAFLLSACDQDSTPFSPQDAERFRSTLAGRVVDPAGTPLRGALVVARPSGATTVSGDSGSFRFSLPSGTYTLSVSKDDYLDTTVDTSFRLALLQDAVGQKVGLVYRYATVEGVVTGSDRNTPIPGAGVVVEDQSIYTLSGERGGFRVGRVEPGEVRLFAASRDGGYGMLDTVLGPSDTLREARLVIDRSGGTVVGRVVGGSAPRSLGRASVSGVGGVVVSALGGMLQTTTAADGGFSLPHVPRGGVTLSFAGSSGSLLVGGVWARDSGTVDIGDIGLVAAPPGDSTVRSALFLGWTTSRALTLAATTGSDSSLHVRRFAWSRDGGQTWDTSATGRRRIAPDTLGWGAGDHSVQVKAVFLDTTRRMLVASRAGTVTIRLRDSTSALDSLVPGEGSLFPAFSRPWSSYIDTVSAATSLLSLRAGAVASISDVSCGSAKCDSLPVSRDTSIEVSVRNPASGSARTYTVRVFHRGGMGGPGLADSVFWNSRVSYGTLLDPRDGIAYRTVRIGGANWMAQNLARVADSSWCPTGSTDSCNRLGRLYSWASAMGIDPVYDTASWERSVAIHRGICPPGWHLPTAREWSALVDSIGRDTAGRALRATRGWSVPGSDAFGFRALPSGVRSAGAGVVGLGRRAGFRVAGELPSGGVPGFGITTDPTVDSAAAGKTSGLSVRCVEDHAGTAADSSTELAGLATDPDQPLLPDFSPDRGAYSVSLPWNATVLPITARTASEAASVTFQGSILPEVPVPRDTVVSVVVTNSGITRTYRIAVSHRPAPDTLPPTIELVSPSRGVVLHNADSVVVKWKVSDPGLLRKVGNSDVAYRFDSVAGVYLQTLHLHGGPAIARVWAWDTSGNSAKDSLLVLRYDTIAASDTVGWNLAVAHGVFNDPRDGKPYRTVTIGGRTWMAENLAYDAVGSRCASDSADSCAKYGRMYSWTQVMGLDASAFASSWWNQAGATASTRGICPEGWHVPYSGDWGSLVEIDSIHAARVLGATTGWKGGSFADSLGFRVLPAGYFLVGQGSWSGRGIYGMFWSGSESSASAAWTFGVSARGYGLKDPGSKSDLYPLRCVADP